MVQQLIKSLYRSLKRVHLFLAGQEKIRVSFLSTENIILVFRLGLISDKKIADWTKKRRQKATKILR